MNALRSFLFFQGLFPSPYILDSFKVFFFFFHIDDSEKRIFE